MGVTEQHFGRQVKKLRSACGISQEDLSFMADIHKSYVGKIERGENSPRLRVMLRIANALGMSVSDLLCIVDESMRHDARSVRRRRT